MVNKKLFWGILLRIIIESYVIGFICCLLNIVVIREESLAPNAEDWTKANSIFVLIVFPTLCLFPFVSACYLYKNFDNLKKKQTMNKFGELY